MECLPLLLSWEWREEVESRGMGPNSPHLTPRGSASRRAICRVGFKKEVRSSLSKVRREMGKVRMRDSAEG